MHDIWWDLFFLIAELVQYYPAETDLSTTVNKQQELLSFSPILSFSTWLSWKQNDSRRSARRAGRQAAGPEWVERQREAEKRRSRVRTRSQRQVTYERPNAAHFYSSWKRCSFACGCTDSTARLQRKRKIGSLLNPSQRFGRSCSALVSTFVSFQ